MNDYGILVVVLIAGLVGLVRSGAILVRSLTVIARFFHISEYLVAAVLMSFATTLPEFFVGVSSAIGGIPDLSLGNIIGANIVNITLITGLVAIISGSVSIESKIYERHFLFMILAGIIPLLLASDGLLSREDGVILFGIFAWYLYRVFREREYFTQIFSELHNHHNHHHNHGRIFHAFGWFFLGAVILLASAAAVVVASRQLAAHLDLPLFFFGLLALGLGTQLPELAFGLRASAARHGRMALGNTLGSVVFNSALILGTVAFIKPIPVTIDNHFTFGAWFLAAALLIFNLFARRSSDLTRREGLVLLALYLIFLVVELMF